MQRTWIALGSLTGLTAVAMAAVAAHGLGGLAMVRSANDMQGWHALALLACGLWAPRGGRLADAAGAAFAVGIVLFCGGVYAVGLGGIRLGMVAPVGGASLMVGWLLLGVSAVATTRQA